MASENTRDLVKRIQSGDQLAATELFDRYVDRLVGLARKNLSPKLSRRLDPEDVAQSAYRSFFRRTREGAFVVDDSVELWRLLAAITINKLRRAVKYNAAKRRNFDAEDSVSENVAIQIIQDGAVSCEPTPEEASVLMDETRRMLADLSTVQMQILTLRLQGVTTEETARQTNCSERTVFRTMEFAKSNLENRLKSQ